MQQVVRRSARCSARRGAYGLLTILLHRLAWGLGYFGMPQVLLRFMAIRKGSELKRSRRIATVWVVISLSAAVFIGIIGRYILPADPALTTQRDAENVFIQLSTKLLFHPLLAGIVMAGILAATISSSDSYLLIAASAVAKNIYQRCGEEGRHRQAGHAHLPHRPAWPSPWWASSSPGTKTASSSTMVSFAWAGFGATFGPLMLFSLFWKRTNRAGAIAGMLSGGVYGVRVEAAAQAPGRRVRHL